MRYAIVGIASNLTGYFVYLLLTYLYFGPKVAMTLVYLAGASVAYVGNRQWTFAHKGKVIPTLLKFTLAHGCGYLLNFLLLHVFVDELAYPHQLVQAAAIFIVAITVFAIAKWVVFLEPGPET